MTLCRLMKCRTVPVEPGRHPSTRQRQEHRRVAHLGALKYIEVFGHRVIISADRGRETKANAGKSAAWTNRQRPKRERSNMIGMRLAAAPQKRTI